MSESFDPQKAFNEYYYKHGCGPPYERNEQWLAFFQEIADKIIADLQPKTALDAGCAKGFLVEGFRNRGIEAWGIDISEHAIQEVYETIKPFCWVGSISDPFPQKYDLIVTIEVLEHMAAPEGKKAIANLCEHTNQVLFTSTPFDYKETTHYNVQPPEYWSREFARHGFFRDVDYDSSYITAWAVLYRKRDEPIHQIAYDYERRFWLLRKENTDLRELSNQLREQVQGLSGQIKNFRAYQESINPQLEQEKAEWESEKNAILLAYNEQINQLRLELKSLYDDLKQKVAQFGADKSEWITSTEDLLSMKKKLEVDLAALAHEKEQETRRADDFQQRWNALEQTRTWKILSTFYKAKKKN